MDFCASLQIYFIVSLVSISKELITDLWLSVSSRKICESIYIGFPGSELSYQDAAVLSLVDKSIVVRSFICGDYEKILMEKGIFFLTTSWSHKMDSRLVLAEYVSCQILLRFNTSAIGLLYSKRVSMLTSLPSPTVCIPFICAHDSKGLVQ